MDLDEEPWLVELLDRFQAAWMGDERPSLEAFLEEVDSRTAGPPGGEAALEILVAFLKIEIEQGWASRDRTGSPAAEDLELGAFAARFPDILGGPESWPEELIVWDYRIRSRYDQTISSAEVLGRYPGRGPSLGERLQEVDLGRPPRIAGHRVKERLGEGGQGEVWLAESLTVHREVAVKVLWSRDPVRLRRLSLELLATGILSGRPGVVTIHDARVDADPPHLIMEYVRGGDLQTRVRPRKAGVPPNIPPPKVAARIVKELAETVDEFHREPVVMFHRDLKPANVLLAGRHDESPEELSWDGLFPKLADFGMVRLRDRDLALTEVGQAVGTPPYMAPEQFDERFGRVDARTDVYGLGGILYFLVFGKAPFPGPRLDPREEPDFGPRPRGDDLKVICAKALQVDPERRYKTARAMADDLGRYIRGEPIEARPPWRIERAYKWAQRHPAWSASLVGAAAALLLIVGLMAREYANAQRIRRYSVAAAEASSLGYKILADPEFKAQTSLAYRTRKLEEARDVLAAFLKLEGESPEALRLSGKAGLVLAEINRSLRKKEDALESGRRAERDYRKLVDELGSGATPDDRRGLASALTLVGTCLAQYMIDPGAGLAKLREALPILESLSKPQGSADPEVVWMMALCRNNIANCLGGAEGAELFADSIRDYADLTRRDPTRGDARVMAIRIRSNRAMALETIGDPGAASQHREAVDLAQAALVELDRARASGKDPDRRLPWEWTDRECLAVVSNNAAEFAMRRGDLEAAVQPLEAAIPEFDRLAARDAANPEFPWDAAMARTNLALALTGQGEKSWDRAEALFQESGVAYASLRGRGLNDGEFWAFVAKNHLYRGILQGRRAIASGGPMDRSLGSIDEAIEALGKFQIQPTDVTLLVEAWLRRAEFESSRGELTAAEGSLGQAVAAIDGVGAEAKDIPIFGYQRIEADLLRAELRSRAGKLDDATRGLAAARDALAKPPGSGEGAAFERRLGQRAEFLAAALLALQADEPGLSGDRKREATDRAIRAIEAMARSGTLRDPDHYALLRRDARFRAVRDEPKILGLMMNPPRPRLRRGISRLTRSRGGTGSRGAGDRAASSSATRPRSRRPRSGRRRAGRSGRRTRAPPGCG